MLRVFLCGLLLAGVALGYDIDEFVRDAKAHHERHLTALNGLKLVVQGEITQPGHESYSIDADYYTRGSKWRAEAELKQTGKDEGFPITVMFDGQKTWATMLGMKLEVPRRDVDDRVRGYLYWEEPAKGSVIAGSETISGRDCWLVTTPLRESDGTAVTMKSWYDKKDFVLVQSESTLDGKPVRMEFSDFKDVREGYALPHSMRAVQEGAQIVSARVLSATGGAEVSDSLFDSAQLSGEDFPDMNELMRTMQIFGKVFTKEVSKLMKP